jgi:hypothetical protein
MYALGLKAASGVVVIVIFLYPFILCCARAIQT